ncbi:uncharacterized protein LOC131956971 [Physella acuta]|uniref:uncharacterized protein LOC131956971 n=1 Tax=Physella acuta TaxID=109671 RepID=UPI0027DC9CA2|nr:uncharacterized protein LOC131956971 [Physella acuta]
MEPAAPPPNFSWVVEGVLAACAFPATAEHLQYLVNNNITTLVSLTAEREVDTQSTSGELLVVRVPTRGLYSAESGASGTIPQLCHSGRLERTGIMRPLRPWLRPDWHPARVLLRPDAGPHRRPSDRPCPHSQAGLC